MARNALEGLQGVWSSKNGPEAACAPPRSLAPHLWPRTGQEWWRGRWGVGWWWLCGVWCVVCGVWCVVCLGLVLSRPRVRDNNPARVYTRQQQAGAYTPAYACVHYAYARVRAYARA